MPSSASAPITYQRVVQTTNHHYSPQITPEKNNRDNFCETPSTAASSWDDDRSQKSEMSRGSLKHDTFDIASRRRDETIHRSRTSPHESSCDSKNRKGQSGSCQRDGDSGEGQRVVSSDSASDTRRSRTRGVNEGRLSRTPFDTSVDSSSSIESNQKMTATAASSLAGDLLSDMPIRRGREREISTEVRDRDISELSMLSVTSRNSFKSEIDVEPSSLRGEIHRGRSRIEDDMSDIAIRRGLRREQEQQIMRENVNAKKEYLEEDDNEDTKEENQVGEAVKRTVPYRHGFEESDDDEDVAVQTVQNCSNQNSDLSIHEIQNTIIGSNLGDIDRRSDSCRDRDRNITNAIQTTSYINKATKYSDRMHVEEEEMPPLPSPPSSLKISTTKYAVKKVDEREKPNSPEARKIFHEPLPEMFKAKETTPIHPQTMAAMIGTIDDDDDYESTKFSSDPPLANLSNPATNGLIATTTPRNKMTTVANNDNNNDNNNDDFGSILTIPQETPSPLSNHASPFHFSQNDNLDDANYDPNNENAYLNPDPTLQTEATPPKKKKNYPDFSTPEPDTSSAWDLSDVTGTPSSRWDEFDSRPGLDDEARMASSRAIAAAAEKEAMKNTKLCDPERTGESVLVLTMTDDEEHDEQQRSMYSIDDEDEDEDERNNMINSSDISPAQQLESESEFTNIQKQRLYSIINGDILETTTETKPSKSSNLPGWLSSFAPSPLSRNQQATSRGASKTSKAGFEDPDAIRAEAMRMIEMADKSSSRSVNSNSPPLSSFFEKRSIEPVPSEDSAATQHTNNRSPFSSFRQFSSSAFSVSKKKMPIYDIVDDEIVLQQENEWKPEDRTRNNNNNSKSTAWSSRYSISHHLPYNSTYTHYDSDDEDTPGLSARGMTRTSPYDTRSSSSRQHRSTAELSSVVERILRNDTPKTKPVVHRFENINLTRLRDIDEEDFSMTSSMASMAEYNKMRQDLIEGEMRKRNIKKMMGMGCAIVALVGVVVAVQVAIFQTGQDPKSLSGLGGANDVTFHLLYSTPHTTLATSALMEQLSNLTSENTDFVLHLGDITDPSVTLCNPSVYYDAAAALFSSSNFKTLSLPGLNDYLYCPDPHMSWQHWQRAFIEDRLEMNDGNQTNKDFGIDEQRQSGKKENFAFRRNDILFLGVNIISSTFMAAQDNIDWVKYHLSSGQMIITNTTDRNEQQEQQHQKPRAVVVFGHVHPLEGKRTERAFFETLTDIVEEHVDGMVLYIHPGSRGQITNADGDDIDTGWVQHYPFSSVKMAAVEVFRAGGDVPPVKVTVGWEEEREWWKFS